MKEVDETMFECEYCRAKYPYKQRAEECEQDHILKNKIDKIENLTEFVIEDKHIKLLKQMNVEWDDCEFGAPKIDPKRPYGNSDVIGDIAEIIGMKKSKENWDNEECEWRTEARDKLYWLHREMLIVLQIVLAVGKIKVGKYAKTDKYDYESWKEVDDVSRVLLM